jgi:threonine dehydratase
VSAELESAGKATARLWNGPIPTLADVFKAHAVIRPHLAASPAIRSESLSALLGCNVIVKCESLLPTGAFKVRGGINYLSRLTREQLDRGVIAASTGNHGQSIAYAARVFGAKASIFVPMNANPLKLAAMQKLGAEIIAVGDDFDACLAASITYAEETGGFFIHSANEPHLIAGVGTYTLELMEFEPNIDVIFTPVGGGSGLCGATITAKGINPAVRVYGVQSSGAPAVYDSWKARSLVTTERADTFAEGIATRAAYELPADILWDRVDDIVLVSDREIKRAILTYLERARLQAEGAGAAPLAAAYARREELQGKTVALILSGGNLTLDVLASALNEEKPL